jgi:ABC-2 type transport system ATP-binding protein
MDALAAEGLSKAYGETQALDGVSVTVEAGEVFAVVGPNGAGKTTFVRCLTGTTTPDTGTVSLLESAPTRVDKHRIGLLPQSFHPPDRLTARELLSYFGGLYRDARSADSVLTAVGVSDRAETRYARLSGGQQRRVCVGISLVNDPEVLFLDEPTTGIDPAGRRAVWSLIDDLTEGGTTVFLTTHDMEEAARLADRVGIIIDGELVVTDSPAAIVERYGGDSRLHVTTTDSVSLAGRSIETVDDGIVIHDIGPEEIANVVEELETENVVFDALTWREPDLETAYLALTGESIPESGGNP